MSHSTSQEDEDPERRLAARELRRRTLLKAGWTIPFIVAISPPLALQGLAAARQGDVPQDDDTSDGEFDGDKPSDQTDTPDGPPHWDGAHWDEVQHLDWDREHQDYSQHSDQQHVDQNHTDASDVDGTRTHHFDSGHGDGQHSDMSVHTDFIPTSHHDLAFHHDANHQDQP